jgi:hypothetical protein
MDVSNQGTLDKVMLKVFCVHCKKEQNYKGIWDIERKNYGIYCPVRKKLFKKKV